MTLVYHFVFNHCVMFVRNIHLFAVREPLPLSGLVGWERTEMHDRKCSCTAQLLSRTIHHNFRRHAAKNYEDPPI